METPDARASKPDWREVVRQPRIAFTAALIAAAAIFPFGVFRSAAIQSHFFETELACTTSGLTQIFYNVGRGYNEHDTHFEPVQAGAELTTFRFPLPPAKLRGLRFDPINIAGEVHFVRPRIVDREGRVLHAFEADEISAGQDVASLRVEGDDFWMSTAAGLPDAMLYLRPPSDLKGRFVWLRRLQAAAPAWFGVFAPVWVLSVFGARFSGERLAWLLNRRPVLSLAGAAALAVAVQSHPVIFFGKSFVSPDNAGYLLYGTFPTLPGYETIRVEDGKGSDTGAMMYHHYYFPSLQRQAVWEHGEWPLWNRYTMCGLPLLGQGQTMFGEALNLLPMLADSASWAWDIKFVLGRWLYAFGVGLAVWLLTRHSAAALASATAAVFIGLFSYRLNHVAQFAVFYAPWVIVSWVHLRDARTRGGLGLALAWLLAANLQLFTSGTLKEAVCMMLGVNFAGGLIVLLDRRPWRERAAKITWAAGAGLAFVLLSAPQWLAFLDALAGSHTNYDAPRAIQIAPWQIVGFFEDLFYRQFQPNELHALPSTNVFVLLGVAWLIVRLRDAVENRAIAALGAAALLPLAGAYGLIPGNWLTEIPFIANIHHINNTFSTVLIPLATVLAGCGAAIALQRLNEQRSGIDVALAALVVLGVAGLYFGTTQDRVFSPFFVEYLGSLALAAVALHAAAGGWRRRPARGVAWIAAPIALALLLWRHGHYVRTPFDDYVFNPQVRADYAARSPAIDFVDALMTEPSRPQGFGYVLFAAFGQIHGWESAYGVDPLRSPAYDELARAAGMRKLYWGMGSPDPTTWSEDDPRVLQPFLDFLNVRYHLAMPQSPARERPGLRLLRSLDLDVYESESAWPRAFFTERVLPCGTAGDLISLLREGGAPWFAGVSDSILGELPEPIRALGNSSAPRAVAASDYRLTTNQTSFMVEASGPGMIVLTENDVPRDFRAFLNGERVDYVRVNHSFKGIPVTRSGKYEVSFEYWPRHFSLALGCAASGVILIAAAAVFFVRKRRVAIFP